MDKLSRDWKSNGDGISRIEFAKLKMVEYFTKKRAKFIWRHQDMKLELGILDPDHIKILDVGSCNGLLAESVDHPYYVDSIDIAPANESVDFADVTGLVCIL